MTGIKHWKEDLNQLLLYRYHTTMDEANPRMLFAALSESLMKRISPDWVHTQKQQKSCRGAYYLSAEFLMGRSLVNNLLSTDLYDEAEAILNEKGLSLKELEGIEPDAALGNGGLGRLAACFLDSAATHDLPLKGYGIYYQFGLFKQRFEDGAQVELPDDWSLGADLWCVRKADEAVDIVYGDQSVRAVPYDMPVVGCKTTTVNTLRLWRSEPLTPLDFHQFQAEHYEKALMEKNAAEIITMVLYPSDATDRGKSLRLKQEYFFVSASIQDMLRQHEAAGRNISQFHLWHAVQLNDTHPAVAIPELIRLLMAKGLSFEEAFAVAQKTFAYTNHTILSEALEKWSVKLFKKVLPQIYPIVTLIQNRLVVELRLKGLSEVERRKYHILADGQIHMAWLSLYGSHRVNGVAAIHTQILKDKALKQWYDLFPERFVNVTNGVTQRRWLKQANPELSALITELLGTEGWLVDLGLLQQLEAYAEDDDVMQRFMAVKALKKNQLAATLFEREGIALNPDALYSVQIKRMHEYKRQLLNALHIYDLFKRMVASPERHWTPRVFIFGAKAAPGYKRAKAVIRFIHWVQGQIAAHPEVSEKLQVVFVENYSVSYAEKLFPAADFSEQISTAGTEASGTGNMKFMLNGTVTLGTYDGANVEIAEAVGAENILIFGETVESLRAMAGTYDAKERYDQVEGLKAAVDALLLAAEQGDADLCELYDSLLKGADWHRPDHYFVLQDFEAYREAHEKAAALFEDRTAFARAAWINLCRSGRFSSDQSIKTYAEQIWSIGEAVC